MRRLLILAIPVALLATCCGARLRRADQGVAQEPRHESPHLDLKADRTYLVRPGTVSFTAFLRGDPIDPEWACSVEEWSFGDDSSALRAEDPCTALDRVYEHDHRYDSSGTYEAKLTLRSRHGHAMPSLKVTITIGGRE